jgi:hypothetical protein
MNEEELLRMGFFEIEPVLTGDKSDVKCFKLFEYYNGVFVRLIVSKHKDIFEVIHLYFDSPKSEELKLEFFGTDLSLENIMNRIKEYRESTPPSEDGPETF